MKYRVSRTAGQGHASLGLPLTGSRIVMLMVICTFAIIIIIGRLFQLQVLRHDEYSAIAKEQHFGAITLPARRGEILVRDTHSGELSKLATNTTLDLVYVDPFVTEDKIGIAKDLAPLLFTTGEYEHCVDVPDDCTYSVLRDEPQPDRFITTEPVWDLGKNKLALPRIQDLDPEYKPYGELVDEVAANILRKISKLEVDFVILKRDADPDLMAEVINAQLPGVFADTKKFLIHADPTLIPENKLNSTAERLAAIIDESPISIAKNLARRKVRYVFLKNKLEPDVSRKIKELDLKGVVLLPEHWRFYPEGTMASNIVGFINREGAGQYGIEGQFNNDLEGKKGTIYAESDPFGRQITVGDSKIVNPVDGDTVVLTIDRVIQKKAEEILAESVPKYKADSGQVLIMDPFTGAIIAMANFPSFDPNKFGDVYTLRPLEEGEEFNKTVPIFKLNEKGKYMPIEEGDRENPDIRKFIYDNKFGPGVFKNKAISEYYEPGSAFKPIIMSIGLDSKEVEPQTIFNDEGPLKIDDFEIKNALRIHYGKITMTEVLENSVNTGMAFVAKKLGKSLMYNYLKDFGFGEYTDITLEGEVNGKLDYYSHWSKAQMLTTAFGQGIIVTPLQLVTAWASLANGGKLMQPYIVDTIIRGGEVIKTEPQVVRRVISEETSSIITSMLVSVVSHGQAKKAAIPGFLIAGKTGTAQIAGKGSKYETGEGAYVTSFASYFPALEPKIVILVKFDRPRMGDNTWGDSTAIPTFVKIADFLIDYYNLEPKL